MSHCGVKGYGVQDISIIEKLIREEVCSFFIYDGEKKRKVYVRTSQMEQYFLQPIPMDPI